MHQRLNELKRITKAGGIIYFTTQGDNFLPKLSKEEKERYLNGDMIERGRVPEGQRTFSAFHSKAYIQQIIKPLEVIKQITEKPKSNRSLPQDAWILRKPL